MQFYYIILALLLSTNAPRQKNILDLLEQRLGARKEQKILKKFRESNCYITGMNYKIQPNYSFMVQPFYVLKLKKIDEYVLTNESFFLKNLHKGKKSIYGYRIYNDSIQQVAYSESSREYFFCYHGDDRKHGYDSIFRYAMENQYLLFFVDGFLGNIYFGYKDGHIIVFEEQFWGDGTLRACNFEDFDWNQPYIIQWKRTAIYGLPLL